MEIVINPAAQRVWRTPQVLQIGFGPDSVVLENLQARHETFIDALFSGLTLEQAQVYARHLKLRSTESQALIKALGPVFLTQPTRARKTGRGGKTLESEITAKEYAEPASLPIESAAFQAAMGEMNQASRTLSARGESVWLRRQTRAVFIDSLDRLGQNIANGLSQAGIGAIITGDLTRAGQLSETLSSLPLVPKVMTLNKISERQIERIDLAVLTGQQLIAPQKFAAWSNRDTPAIAAIVASVADSLSPFLSHVIEPGITPCWVCLEFQRKQADADWPDMASQIIGREMPFDSASASLMLAGQTVELALAYLDAANGFEKANASTSALKWSFHDECGCRLGSARSLLG